MGDKVVIKHAQKYTLTDALQAAASTPQEKKYAERIGKAKLYNMSFEAGKDSLDNLGVTNDEFANWLKANKGKKFVVPEIHFSFTEPGKVYKEDFVSQVEKKEGTGDDYAAKYVIMMLIKGITEHTTSSGNKITLPQGHQEQGGGAAPGPAGR